MLKSALHFLLLFAPVVVLNLVLLEEAPTPFAASPLPPGKSPRLRFERMMAERQPQVVVIGNSVIERNVDGRVLSDELGLTVRKVAQPAIGPAWIYLALENVVLRADPLPRLVVIGFREDELLRSGYRTTGFHKKYIDDMAVDDELEVLRLLREGESDALGFWLDHHSRLFRERDDWKEDWHRRIQSILTGNDAARIEAAGRAVFDDENRDEEVGTADGNGATGDEEDREARRWRDSRRWPFEDRIDRSFVPLIIDLAERRGVEVLFLRMRQKRHARGEWPADRFVAEFSRYLEDRGLPFADMSRDEGIGARDFAAYDHVKKRAVAAYSRAVARALAPHVERLRPR